MNDLASANKHAARLVGSHIYQFRVAHALALDFESDDLLIIETPISASSSAGTWTGEPTDGGAIDVLLPLLYQPVAAAGVQDDGSIQLTFENGTIEIKPHPTYESWQLATQENWLAICVPGGGLALWE